MFKFGVIYKTKVQSKLASHLKNALKSKTSLVALADKIQPLSADDSGCKQLLGKIKVFLQCDHIP